MRYLPGEQPPAQRLPGPHLYHNDITNANLLLCHACPVERQVYHFCMAINLDKYQQRHAAHDKVLYQEALHERHHPRGHVRDRSRKRHPQDDEPPRPPALSRPSPHRRRRCDDAALLPLLGCTDALPISREIQPFSREEIHAVYEHFLTESMLRHRRRRRPSTATLATRRACRTSSASSSCACASTTAPTATSRSSTPRPNRWKKRSRSCRH